MGIHSKGFTLLEILVVVAIIGIITAIVFPVFSQAREKGRQSTCISHIRQVQLTYRLYVDDNDGVYPSADYWRDLSRTHPELGCCPTVASSIADARQKLNNSKRFGDIDGIPGYALNSQFFIGGKRDSSIRFPATTILICEREVVTLPGYPAIACGPDPFSNTTPYPYDQVRSWERHQGGAHYAFIDGHVKWLKSEQIHDCNQGNDGTVASFDLRLPTEKELQ